MSAHARKPTDDLIDVAANVANESDECGGTVDVERRDEERYRYHEQVAILLLNPSGEPSKPMIARGRDISTGGICVVARHMIHAGSVGIIQLLRSDGTPAFIGIRVKYCHYAGNMQHHIGMQFVQIPQELSRKSFADDDGNLMMLKRADPSEGGQN